MVVEMNPRRRRRRRRKNSWPNSRSRHARAARRGWRKRRRRRNPVSYNRRHRRGRRRRRNPNGGGGGLTLRRPIGALTAGLRPATWMKAVPLVGGALGNAWLSGIVSGMPFVPGMLRSGIGGYALSLGTAGLLGAGVGMLNRGWAAPVFFGGVLETLIRATRQYIMPLLPLRGLGSFFGDYLTPMDAAMARPLGEFGDYLTRADAASARPLYGLDEQEQTASEELAAL